MGDERGHHAPEGRLELPALVLHRLSEIFAPLVLADKQVHLLPLLHKSDEIGIAVTSRDRG